MGACKNGTPKQGDLLTSDLADADIQKSGGTQKKAINITGATGAMRGVMGAGTYQGQVKSFNPAKGFGFVICEGQEIFVHARDCCGGLPKQGETVAFDLEDNPMKPGTKKA